MDPTTLVAYAMDGEPLPPRHGLPAGLLVLGVLSEKCVKRVTRIELVERPVAGSYERQGWGPNFVVPTRARFDVPPFPRAARARATTALRGVAFSGDAGTARVEVSADGGGSRQEATLTYPGTHLSWALWRYNWRPPRAGDYPLVVRATTGTGAPQIATDRGIVPHGATGNWLGWAGERVGG
jgi:DMSO/TMAO reductase YedYZ molybdopterin-dependent catalytic subunit